MIHEGSENCPEISVLMSCFNSHRWLSEAIDSVLCQSFTNFEFIIVDDGSTDDTWKIIEEYSKKDHRIITLKKKNTGLADSLNTGLLRARGTWIARIDADDICERDRLSEQLLFVTNHPDIILLGCSFNEIDENGILIKKQIYPTNHTTLVKHLERMQRFFPHSSAFIKYKDRKDLVCYNSYFKKSQDKDLWLRLASTGKIACLKQTLVRIRKHPNQISKDNNNYSQIVYSIAASIVYFFRIHNINDPSTDYNETSWLNFLNWIKVGLENESKIDRKNAWNSARIVFFNTKNRIKGFFLFCLTLLKSGIRIDIILYEKLFGTSLPKRFAHKWLLQDKNNLAPRCREIL